MKKLEKLENCSLNPADLTNILGGQSYVVHHNLLGLRWDTHFVVNPEVELVDKYRTSDDN